MTRPITAEERRIVAEAQALAAEFDGVPYFARLRVRTAAGERDVLLGDRARVGEAAAVVEWRSAPLAAVFFGQQEGDDYEIEVDGRVLAGTVVRREVVHFAGGELVGIDRADAILRRGPDGWSAEAPVGARLVPRAPEQRRRGLAPADVVLDAVQRGAVKLPGSRSLLVLGEAGFGKTTVALHRIARLAREAHAARSPFRALVIVPTPGLQRLAARMLADLGVTRVVVETFERWVSGQARRLFPALPKRLSSGAPPAVRRLKRHPALRTALPRIAAGTAAMREVRAGYRDSPETIRDLLLHLFGDRALMDEVVAAAGGAIAGSTVDELLAHTKVQFTATTERAMRHVDAERLQALDGRPLDAGTPLADAETIDVEDLAVVFALHRRMTGGDRTEHGALSQYQHVLLDEAQELAPIELELLGRAVAPGGAVTVAGDERQQVDPTSTFVGWPGTLAELGVEEPAIVTLAASYRCPQTVEDVARAVLDPRVGSRPQPRGAPVVCARHEHLGPLVAALGDGLAALLQDDPRLTAAVVCRHVETARRLHALLRHAVPARLVIGGEFTFRPGVDVTTVHEVKGLEFDVVAVPDVDAASYADAPESRRALYVALTRAVHQAWLLAAGPWSRVLPAWLVER